MDEKDCLKMFAVLQYITTIINNGESSVVQIDMVLEKFWEKNPHLREKFQDLPDGMDWYTFLLSL